MISQQYFSDGEWAALLDIPRQAILVTVLADRADPVAFLQEVEAAVQIMQAELARQDFSSDLVQSVVNSLRELASQNTLQGEALVEQQVFDWLKTIRGFSSASEGQKTAIANINQIRDTLLNKVPIAQAEEYKAWVLNIATQVAKAVKERKRLGIGGERVTNAEADAISSIDKALSFKR